MSSPTLDTLFNRLDEWRHLPAYQLERRADIFFALFLPEVLEARCGALNPLVIPEFPLRKGTLWPKKYEKSNQQRNRSAKADYAVFTKNCQTMYLVELKTDSKSFDKTQYNNYKKAQNVGLHALIEGILRICENTKHIQKYVHLLKRLCELDLVTIPKVQCVDNVTAAYRKVQNTVCENWKKSEIKIVYVQPTARLSSNIDIDDAIDFEEFARIAEKRGEVGKVFAGYLRKWNGPAGE